jgi:hypothetical protein
MGTDACEAEGADESTVAGEAEQQLYQLASGGEGE